MNGGKQEKWRMHVEGWRASGLSQRAYCVGEGLKLSTFQYWTRRLRDAPEVSGVPVPVGWLRPVPGMTPALAIVVEGRYRVEVGEYVHPDTLATVLDVLWSR